MFARPQVIEMQESMLARLLHPDPRKPTYQRLGQHLVSFYARTGDVYGAALRVGAFFGAFFATSMLWAGLL